MVTIANIVEDKKEEKVPDIVKQSKLSVEAKEWYPPGYNSGAETRTPNISAAPSIQDRLRRPRFERNASTAEADIERLSDAIKLLTMKPGKFEAVVTPLLETLEPRFYDVDFITKVTTTIFNQALKEPNFQYSAARLCAMLDANCPILRGWLHSLCEKELEKANNLPMLTLFIAEIYSQLNFGLFGASLINALKQLIKANTPDTIKYACQTLKLSGKNLESLDDKALAEILTDLEHFNTQPQCPSNIKNLIQSVLTLSKKNWGKEEAQAIPPPAEPNNWSDGPVFYGPDGMELTSEESEFLADSLEDFVIDETDPDALWEPEAEMNEEIQAAFAEFVRSSHR